MTLKPWFALTLMAIGYVGAVAAGGRPDHSLSEGVCRRSP